MSKEQPLWHRLYFDPLYTEVARVVGYSGFPYREMEEKLTPLFARFGKQKVESAVVHLATYEGQFTCNPKPLAEVKLRAEVRKLCWQLLGPPPEHPEFEHFKSDQPWVPPWNRKPAEPEPKPEPPKAPDNGEAPKKKGRPRKKAS